MSGTGSLGFLRSKTSWVKYSLPSLGVWLAYWLAYYPGLADADALLTQWGQIVRGEFWDGFTAVYILVDWLVTRLWFSPAAISLAQLLVFAGVIGWGLSRFARHGVPSWFLWLVSALFALSPVMGTVSITPWKDVPYGISILWLTLLIMELVISKGRWIASSLTSAVGLGVALAAIALFRHEGIAIALPTILLLAVVYRTYWKRFAIALLVFLACWVVVLGPVYDFAHVARVASTPGFAIHHVAAIVASGAPLSAKETEVLEKILPIQRWKELYDPYIDYTIMYAPDSRLHDFPSPDDVEQQEIRDGVWRVWGSLVSKYPLVALKTTIVGGEIVWRVTSDTAWYTIPTGIPDNDLGLKTVSKWPEAKKQLTRIVERTQDLKWSWLFWRPALYLYVLIALTVLVAVRARDAAWLLYATPSILQAASVLVLIHNQYFRYLFGVYLVGFMSLCLIWFIVRPPGTGSRSRGLV